jgi:hypothetical protein
MKIFNKETVFGAGFPIRGLVYTYFTYIFIFLKAMCKGLEFREDVIED